MDARERIISMLKRLLEDMSVIQQPGTGYYSCAAIAKRFNKLLEASKPVIGASDPLVSTFEPLLEADPKDPGEKIKVLSAMRIEIGQLIALLESYKGVV